MPRMKFFGILGAVVFLTTILDPSKALFAQNKSEPQYQVLSPWAEVEPIPLRGLSASRVDTLAGKENRPVCQLQARCQAYRRVG